MIELAREASIELNIADLKDLDASREILLPGAKLYVSHLPGQNWEETVDACRAIRAVGFNPVPHIPVRLIPNLTTLQKLVLRLTCEGDVQEVLLIAGDYDNAIGPFSEVAQVLQAFPFAQSGIARISFAGHPEGHPKVSLEVIRSAELNKIALALQSGLQVTLMTQFFFEAEPFLQWTETLKPHRSDIRIVAGIAGPANSRSLFKFALRCGVGPSMRALVANPSAIVNLVRDHGPEGLLCDLADSLERKHRFTGLHFFGFGGFLRTCTWLRGIVDGRFRLEGNGFKVLA